MALTKEDLKQLDRLFDTRLGEQAKLFDTRLNEQSKLFDRRLGEQAKGITNSIAGDVARLFQDALHMIDKRFQRVEDTLTQHTEILNEHTVRLERIEHRQIGE